LGRTIFTIFLGYSPLCVSEWSLEFFLSHWTFFNNFRWKPYFNPKIFIKIAFEKYVGTYCVNFSYCLHQTWNKLLGYEKWLLLFLYSGSGFVVFLRYFYTWCHGFTDQNVPLTQGVKPGGRFHTRSIQPNSNSSYIGNLQ